MPDLQDITRWLGAEVLSGRRWLERPVSAVRACDLMSDVLSFNCEDVVLLTGLTHQQVVRTAEVAGIRAVVFVRNKRPDQDVLAMATDFELPILGTRLSLFEASGVLFIRGLRGKTPGRR